MRFKANPTEIEAHKIVAVLPPVDGKTTVSAEEIGQVTLDSRATGKYDAGVGDYVVKDADGDYLLPAHVFNDRFSEIKADEKLEDEKLKQSEVRTKQDVKPQDDKEQDVHSFLDQKNKDLA